LQLCIHSKTSFVVTSFRGRHLGTLPPAIVAFAVTVALVFWRMWGGSGRRSPLRRTGFAPAGRQTEFHEIIASPISFGPAFPGRTVLPVPQQRLDANFRRATLGLLGEHRPTT
jgi:hypothetical protein